MPSFVPVTPDLLVDTVVGRVADLSGRRCVAVSGHDAAAPVDVATRVAARLRLDGRAADVVVLHDFVRPASLRFEHGRSDPDSYRWGWFDYAALAREVVGALQDRGQWLPRLWDAQTDRSARAHRLEAPDGQVLVVAGPMLLGRGLDFDVTVHLAMSRQALERTTPPADHWTIPAVLGHDEDTDAQFVVRYDHPDRPALRIRPDID